MDGLERLIRRWLSPPSTRTAAPAEAAAHPGHQRRRHQRAGTAGPGAGRAQLSDDVWVVAPETNQSGASHSLTMHRPLRIRQVSQRRFAVDGTPTDCVLLALQIVIKGGPGRAGAVRRQSRRQSRRGRDLLGHHRRGHGGDLVQRPGDRASARAAATASRSNGRPPSSMRRRSSIACSQRIGRRIC